MKINVLLEEMKADGVTPEMLDEEINRIESELKAHFGEEWPQNDLT